MRHSRTAYYPAPLESACADVGGPMPDEPKSISRRTLAGSALSIPVVGASYVAQAAATESVGARCREWLAGAAEHERLSLRWQSLESQMMRRP